jgi:hypothetical protein
MSIISRREAELARGDIVMEICFCPDCTETGVTREGYTRLRLCVVHEQAVDAVWSRYSRV